MSSAGGAQPFVKWVGGKRSLIPTILSLLPDKFESYFEPFAGGGALYFALAPLLKKATLVDRNLELVLAYQSIKKHPGALIARLQTHARKHSTEYFYKVRNQRPTEAIEVAARFLYLNKTCFNGLYRVNRAGGFNSPMGSYRNPNIVQADNIKACHRTLADTAILYGDFLKIEPMVGAGDFVYLDPPYHPTGEVSFTKYTKENFTEQDQVRLRDFVVRLHKRGTLVMLSNSNTAFIRELYDAKYFHQHIVMAPRAVNCKPLLRNHVEELLITNYPTKHGASIKRSRERRSDTSSEAESRTARQLHRELA
jgi:DNA adenine methylase